MAKETGRKLVAQNRKARHDYHIEDTYEAGLVLTGTEVKSLRAGRASLVDGFAHVDDGEVWLRGVHIPEYSQGTWTNHAPRRTPQAAAAPRRDRRLIGQDRETGGVTLVPLSLYFSDGTAKVEIALATGKRELRQAPDPRASGRTTARPSGPWPPDPARSLMRRVRRATGSCSALAGVCCWPSGSRLARPRPAPRLPGTRSTSSRSSTRWAPTACCRRRRRSSGGSVRTPAVTASTATSSPGSRTTTSRTRSTPSTSSRSPARTPGWPRSTARTPTRPTTVAASSCGSGSVIPTRPSARPRRRT